MSAPTNDPKIFDVEESVLKLNDARIILLKNKKMTQLEFMRLIRHDDPFQIMNGRLIAITKEMQDSQKNGFLTSQRQMMLQTGGIQPNVLLDNPLFEEIYPEIKEDLTKIKSELDLATCKSCEKNRKLQPILMKLFTVKYDGRDLTKLSSSLNEMSMLKLKGELTKEYVDKVEIVVPMGIAKRHIDLIDAENEIDTSLIQNPLMITRTECKDCFKKHIASAAVLLQESIVGGYTFLNGYYHEDLAAAHVREAIDEILKIDKSLAESALQIEKQINNAKVSNQNSERLKIINSLYKLLSDNFQIDSFELIGLLNRLEELMLHRAGDIEGAALTREIRLRFAHQTEKAKQ